MKIFTLILLTMFCLFSCKQKQKQNTFSLEYTKKDNEVVLKFKNKTSQHIVFLTPNTLEFGDKNFKDLSTQGGMEGSFPITVYAIIKHGQYINNYQKKLDSVINFYFSERGMPKLKKEWMPGDGHSVFYLQKNGTLELKYDLIIKASKGESYSSTYQQNYYPYEKILKGQYPEGEYLRRFSKLNFGEVKFVAQPIIEDSLQLKISEKDVTN